MLVIVITLVSSLVLLVLTKQHAVNVLFWDEWDYYTPYFNHYSLWTQFAWQHGPHRMGLGGIIIGFLNIISDWDNRWVCYSILFVFVLSSLMAVKLSNEIFKEPSWTDAFIPIVVLTTVQMEVVVTGEELSQYALPRLLIFLYAYCLVSKERFKIAALLLIQFFIWFTGYAMVFVPACIATLGVNLLSKKPILSRNQVGALFLGQLLSGYLYLRGYMVLHGTAVGISFSNVFKFLWLLGATFTGLGITKMGMIVGCSFVLALVFIAANSSFKLIKEMNPADTSIFILVASTLSYITFCTYGRASIADGAAVAGRYMPMISIGMIVIYFQLKKAYPWFRDILSILIGAICIHGSVLFVEHGHDAWYYTNIKQGWIECYLKRHDASFCNEMFPPGIYPNIEATRLNDKMWFLEGNNLSFFKDNNKDIY